MRAGFRLGVDFGTSHTVAVLRWPDGRVRPLLFDGSPMLPSAVWAQPTGSFAVGRDALDSARMDPGRYEPNPKRRIDDGLTLIGDREVPIVEVIAAVLRRVADEARRIAGGPPQEVTITYPATWASPRRQVLQAAAVLAGLGKARLVEEPVAAATYFAQVLGQHMPAGAVLVVYDFGGGTFDVTLVERAAKPHHGLRTLAVDGLDNIGGLDLDEALIGRIASVYGAQDPGAWRQLTARATLAQQRQWRQFRDDVRLVKERLSRHPTAELHIPGLDRDVHLTRDELEHVAGPLLEQTVRLTESVLRQSGVPRERIAGVFLVGGSSRIPLVATLVHRRLGIAPTVIEQPELVVAEGAILVERIVAAATVPSGPPAALSAAPAGPEPSPGLRFPAGPASPAPAETPMPSPRKVRRRWLAVGGAALALAVLAASLIWWNMRPDGEPNEDPEQSTLPVACQAIAPGEDIEAAPAGSQPTTPIPFEKPGWRYRVDPNFGFRSLVPDNASERQNDTTVCFDDGQRFTAVSAWRQTNNNLVQYWTRHVSRVGATLEGYQQIRIDETPVAERFAQFVASAEWEFTFRSGDVEYRAIAYAVRAAGDRGYAVLWCTRAVDWNKNQADGSTLLPGFTPSI